jgi:hypothetical protein
MKLMAVSTAVRSTVGNMSMQLFKAPEIALSGALNRAISSLSRGRIQRDRFSREVIADYVGMKSGFADGMKAARSIVKENVNAINENLFLRQEFGGARHIAGRKGRVIRIGQNVQGALDAMVRIPAIRGEAYRRATRELLQSGADAGDLARLVPSRADELLKNDKIRKQIEAAAATQTFQAELGEFGKFINGLRRAGIKLDDDRVILRGAGQLVIPFFNTAANLFKEFIKRTPLSLLRPEFWMKDFAKAVKTGEFGDLTDSLARIATGSAFFVASNELISHALQGTIHGKGPRSSAQRNALFAKGWQPYSIEINGRYVSYLGFEPMSSFLGAIADFNEGRKEGGTAAAFRKATSNIVNTFAENPFLQGVTDLADLARGQKNREQYFAGLVSGAVIPSIVRQSVAVVNPELRRKPEGLQEAFSNAFLLKNVEPRFNPLGQAAKRRGTISNLFAFRTTKETKDPVVREINAVGFAPGTSRSFKGIKLSEQQANKLNEVAGRKLYEAIARLISNPSFVKMPKEARLKVYKNARTRIFEAQKRAVFGFNAERLRNARSN